MQVDELEAAPVSGNAEASSADQEVISMPKSRGYQQEMLEESLVRNIVIALDTGAGKTHIAVLRMKLEVERESAKVRRQFLRPLEMILKMNVRYAGFWPRRSHSRTNSTASSKALCPARSL